MSNDERSPDPAPESQPDETGHTTGETSPMVNEGALNSTELRKRRSTRIVQAVPLNVTGVDALGRPFTERTSTLIINCHGCRYQSKHYVLKNMWVNLEVPSPEPGYGPRRVRGKVAWIQRPRTVRQLFQVALELEQPGNAWGIAFPPEDWIGFQELSASLPGAIGSPEMPTPPMGTPPLDTHASGGPESENISGAPDNVRVFPAPTSTTDASMQLARQVARLLSEAKQQIQAASREAAVHAVAAERRLAFEQWEQKFSAFREEIGRETAQAIDSIQEQTATRSRTAQAAAAEALKSELPKWLSPQLEQLTHELTAHLAREGAAQREQHEKQMLLAQETLQTLCAQAENVAGKLRTQAESAEAQVSGSVAAAAREAEEVARQRQESAAAHQQNLQTALSELNQHAGQTVAEAQNALRAQVGQEIQAAQTHLQGAVQSALEIAQQKAEERMQQRAKELRAGIKEEAKQQQEEICGVLDERARELEASLARANEAAERIEHFSERIDGARQMALGGFQSQLDDVLSLHRNELHRQSDSIFEEIHSRIRASFDTANSQALQSFEQQVQSMVAPHLTKTEEAVHRLAGGRSLLDAAMTMQQDRIRATADEAFAESLSRFRENLGSVEQLLEESAQTITARNLEDLESKASDIKHHSTEEMFKSAEWYEKKAQTQLLSLTEKLVEQAGGELRQKAGEVSGLFASELDNASRNYVGQAHQQLDETVRDAFERVRVLFAEAADTTSAAFTDEIQRNARQELEGFNDLVQRKVDESREILDAARVEMNHKVSDEQEEFLRRFQSEMQGAVERGLNHAQEAARANFDALFASWKAMSDATAQGLRETAGQISNESAEQYRSRLENISNSWMVATVTTLDHQSRDVISKIAATAEERLREASAEVFSRFGDTLRERLQQIAAGFGTQPPAKN
jgi:hypothetical protein